MDSTIGGTGRVSAAVLNSPAIDIFSNHYYGNPASELIMEAKFISSKKKVFIVGEYGLINANYYKQMMSACVNSPECTGTLIWSLR